MDHSGKDIRVWEVRPDGDGHFVAEHAAQFCARSRRSQQMSGWLKKSDKGFHWNLHSNNGKAIATSEHYESRRAAVAGIEAVRKKAKGAKLVDADAKPAKTPSAKKPSKRVTTKRTSMKVSAKRPGEKTAANKTAKKTAAKRTAKNATSRRTAK